MLHDHLCLRIDKVGTKSKDTGNLNGSSSALGVSTSRGCHCSGIGDILKNDTLLSRESKATDCHSDTFVVSGSSVKGHGGVIGDISDRGVIDKTGKKACICSSLALYRKG